MKRSIILMACLMAVALATGAEAASTWTVPAGDYAKIQDALDDTDKVKAGDTIHVTAATAETGQLVIDRNLTIDGDGTGTTIITKNENTGNPSSGDDRGWILVEAGVSLTLSDLTLDGVGKKIAIAVLSYGTAVTVQDCVIKNIGWNPSTEYYGRGVCVYDGTGTIARTDFSNIGRIGVFLFDSPGHTTATIDECTYTGKGTGNWLDYGFELGGGASAAITNSQVSACVGVATVDGSTSAGMLITTYFGGGTSATITGCTVSGCTEGIAVGYDGDDTSAVIASSNNLAGNDVKAIASTSADALADASGNWYGSNDPATVAGVAGPNVDYTPWLDTDTDLGDPGFQGDFSTLWVDDTSPQTGTTGRIQEGVNLVTSSTVNVAAGTYQENDAGWRDMAITKSLSLIGAGSGSTVVELTEGKMNGVEIYGSGLDVTIQGMTFTHRPEKTYGPEFAIRVGEVASSFTSLVFRDVEVEYGAGQNILIGKNGTYTSITVEDCNIHHSGALGLIVRGTVTSMTVTDSKFDDNGAFDPAHGIGFDFATPIISNLVINGGSFSNNKSKGINLAQTSNATFHGITASNNGGAPAGGFGVSLWEWVGASSNLCFCNSTFAGNSTDGFQFGTEGTCTISDVKIAGCTFTGNGRSGVHLYGTYGGSISNISVEYSKIVDTGWGVWNNYLTTVKAENNWWGTLEGANISDMVNGDVAYDPWLWTSQIQMAWGGARLVALQNTDGGWDWPLDDSNPASPSPLNTIGPIGMGLAKAYRARATGDTAMLTALGKAATFLQGKTCFSCWDGLLAAELDHILGGTANVAAVNAGFYGPLATGNYTGHGGSYDTAGFVDLIIGSQGNLAGWNTGVGIVSAVACGADTTEWVRGTKEAIDLLDPNEQCAALGLAGAVYGLAYIGEDHTPTGWCHSEGCTNVSQMAALLADQQMPSGGFTAYVGDPTPGNEFVQETAYAILALNEIGGHFNKIVDAIQYLENVQFCTGGWENGPLETGENNEYTAEAMWGLSLGNLLELNVTPATLYVRPEDPVTIHVDVGNLLQNVIGYQAVVNFSSSCFLAGDGEVTVVDGGGLWDDLIYDTWTTGGDLDVAVGIQYDKLATGTDVDATTAVITLTAEFAPLDTTTQVVFRADVNDTDSTWLTDMSAQAVSPNKVDSLTIVIDGTLPSIDITHATQNSTELLGTTTNAVQGRVDIDVEASDALAGLAGPPTVTVTDSGTTSMTVTYDGENPAGTFNYHVIVESTTANGVATINAEVTDNSGNTASDTDTFNINKNQITGTVEMDTLSGDAYNFARDVVFKATDAGDVVLKTWTVTVTFTNNTVTKIASGTYTPLTDVPDTTANLSAKTAWALRRRLESLSFPDGQATAAFTGANKLLGGDLNGTNTVNILDYAILKLNWVTPNAVADINGDGGVAMLDYSILVGNWFQRGDAK